MSGSLNSFRANLTFGNLEPHQFEALYEEVLKEKAKRLIGEEALNTGIPWNEVVFTADLRLSGEHCVIVAHTWDLKNKDLQPWSGEQYPQIIRGFDGRPGYGPPIPMSDQIVIPEGSAIPVSGAIAFASWDNDHSK